MIAVQDPAVELSSAPEPEPAGHRWTRVVKGIQTGDPAAMAEMYEVFTTGIRFYLCRQLGPQDLDDRVHEAFLTITQSIRRGDIREPERLMGYVRTVVRRLVATQIEAVVLQRQRQLDPSLSLAVRDSNPNPERLALERERSKVAFRVLRSLPSRDREVLVRFYLKEQSPAQICRDLGLTATQFRVTKSRAKLRFGKIGRAHMAFCRGAQPEA